MPETNERTDLALDSYRSYLLLLARMQLDSDKCASEPARNEKFTANYEKPLEQFSILDRPENLLSLQIAADRYPFDANSTAPISAPISAPHFLLSLYLLSSQTVTKNEHQPTEPKNGEWSPVLVECW